MEVVGWILVIACFIVSFVGLVYPIIPGVIFLVGGFLLYGLFFSFADLSWWFWVIELLFVVLLFGADTVANAFGIKKVRWLECGHVGQYNWFINWAIRHPICRDINWSIFRCCYCRASSGTSYNKRGRKKWCWFTDWLFNINCSKRCYSSRHDCSFLYRYLTLINAAISQE